MKSESEWVDLKHEDYCEHSDAWNDARNVVEGERKIKECGQMYLPKLEAQTNEEYEAYKSRAKFLNATGRTVDGLKGMVFRRDPIVRSESNLIRAELAKQFIDDSTLSGVSLNDYAQKITEEVITVARAGTLVDYIGDENRTALMFYCTESIWNWRFERVNGQMKLVMLLLHEEIESPGPANDLGDIPESLKGVASQETERLRLLTLDTSGKTPTFISETFTKKEEGGKEKWISEEVVIPSRNGIPLDFIPFVFHGPCQGEGECEKLPLEDLISVNLHHYRLSADYNHGLHWTGLPAPYFTGTKKEQLTSIKVGGSSAIVLENKDASCGFLEFKGEGLKALQTAIEEDKKDMTILGARLLEEQKRDAETAETQRMRQGGEFSILATIANSVSRSLTDSMRIAFWWMSNAKTVLEFEDVKIELNTDYTLDRLDPASLSALVNTWIRGGISKETMLWNLQRGEILPPGQTIDKELEQIAEDTAEFGTPPGGRGSGDNK